MTDIDETLRNFGLADDDPPPMPPNLEEELLRASISTLEPRRWPSLIADMLLKPENCDQICARYHTTPAEVKYLLEKNEAFQATIREMKQRLDKAGGSDDSFMMRAQLLAEEHLPDLSVIARDRNSSTATQLKAIDKIMELAYPENKRKVAGEGKRGGGSGVTMTFVLGNVPRIDGIPATHNQLDANVPRAMVRPTRVRVIKNRGPEE